MEAEKMLYTQYPSHFLHGVLAAHCADAPGIQAGKSKVQKADPVKFEKDYELLKVFRDRDKYDLNKSLLSDWQVLEVYDFKDTGYLGIIYINEKTKQMVLAHRSTAFLLSLVTPNLVKESGVQIDMEGVLLGNITKHQAHAFLATKEAVKIAKERRNYALSFTGHSLGSFLAALSVYYCVTNRELDYKYAKAIIFDGPGPLDHMKKMSESQVKGLGNSEFNEKDLDIVSYLSAPNLVNCTNKHVGMCYRLFPTLDDTKKWLFGEAHKNGLMATVRGHALEYILPEFNIITGLPKRYKQVTSWPSLTHEDFGKGPPKYNPSHLVGMLIGDSLCPNILRGLFNKVVGAVTQENSDVIEKGMDRFGLSAFIWKWGYRAVLKGTTVGAIAKLLHTVGKVNQDQLWVAQQHLDATDGYATNPTDELKKFQLEYEGNLIAQDPMPYNCLVEDKITRKLQEIWEYREKIHSLPLDREFVDYIRILLTHYRYLKASNTIVSNEPMTIEQLRDCMRFLLHCYPQDLNTFIDNAGSAIERKIASSLGYSEVENQLLRDYYNEKIKNALTKKDIVVIEGLPGVGKTLLARKICRQIAFDRKLIAKELKGTSADAFYASYAELLRELRGTLGLVRIEEGTHITLNAVVDEVHNRIVETKQRFIFLIDNLDDKKTYDSLCKYIHNIPPDYVQIIITTRYANLYPNSEEAITIQLESFSQEEALKYLQQQKQLKITPELAQKIIKHTGTIAQNMSLAVAWLKDIRNHKRTAEQLVEEIPSFLNENSLLRLVLKCRTPIEWSILNYLAWLDPDSIAFDLIIALIECTNEELYEALKSLEASCLINFVGLKEISIHREVQVAIASLQNQKTIVSELVRKFDSIFPEVQAEPIDIERTDGLLLLSHLRSLLTFMEVRQITVFSDNTPEESKTQEFELDEESASAEGHLLLKIGLMSTYVIIDYDTAMNYFKRGLKKSQTTNNQTNIAMFHGYIAELYTNLRNFDAALAHCQESLTYFTHLNDCIELSNALERSAAIYWHLRDYTKALDLNMQVLQIRRTFYQGAHLKVATALKNVAVCFDARGEINDKSQAVEYYDKAIETWRSLSKLNSAGTATCYHNIALFHQNNKDYDTALKFFEEALRISKNITEGASPSTAQYNFNIGGLYFLRNDYEKALMYHQKAYDMRNKLYKDNHPAVADSLSELGCCTVSTPDISLMYHKEALRIRETIFGSSHATTLDSLCYIGAVLVDSRNFSRAIGYFEKVYNAYVEAKDMDNITKLMGCLARLYGQMGFVDKSLEYYKQALSLSFIQKQTEECKDYLYIIKKLDHWYLSRSCNSSIPERENIIEDFCEYTNREWHRRILVKKRGVTDERIYKIHQMLQKTLLSPLTEAAFGGKWIGGLTGLVFWGVRDYISNKYIKQQLGADNTDEDVEIALMLCFEAINIGVMKSNRRYIDISRKFIENYPKTLSRVVNNHPQYFVDGTVVKELVMDMNLKKDILGDVEISIEPETGRRGCYLIFLERESAEHITINQKKNGNIENFPQLKNPPSPSKPSSNHP